MKKLLTLAAALTGLFAIALVTPAGAAERKADGARNAAVDGWEISAHRRSYRHKHRRYYPRYSSRYYYRPYPYYGYSRPYYRPYPYYYGAPGFGFSFRF